MEDNLNPNEQNNESQQAPPAADQAEQPSEPSQGQVPQESKTLGMLCHLLGFLTSFLGPLILWLVKKDTDAFVDDQGKESLNWQITVALAGAATCITCVLIPILLPIVGIADLVFSIIACIKASNGECYRYPVCLRLIK